MAFVSDSTAMTTRDVERRLELKSIGVTADRYRKFTFITETDQIDFMAADLSDQESIVWSIARLDQSLSSISPETAPQVKAQIVEARTSFRNLYGMGPDLPVKVLL